LRRSVSEHQGDYALGGDYGGRAGNEPGKGWEKRPLTGLSRGPGSVKLHGRQGTRGIGGIRENPKYKLEGV